ncbi:aldo/keto reductase [Alienimonas sp. DA493]|uniref:aldo/keto reductase n=1 Tax=Alienimonas sp. DA493 TaxID=3373605 RepID=UPI003755010F
MTPRPLGRTGLSVSPVSFGAFKIGRNRGIKYPTPYPLPTDAEAESLLNAALDAGVTLIDTAPAYGASEARIGRFLAHRREEFALCTKVGERWGLGPSGESVSRYDFSRTAVFSSVVRSLRTLKTDAVDLLLIHSDGRDAFIQNETDAVETLLDLKSRGLARGVGLSGKTPAGCAQALTWADVVMVEYHADDTSHAAVMAEAERRGVGVLVKKALAAGRHDPAAAVRFGLDGPGVSSLVIGTASAANLRANVAAAEVWRPGKSLLRAAA